MGNDRPRATESRAENIRETPAKAAPPPDRPGRPGSPSRLESLRDAREAAIADQSGVADADEAPEADEKVRAEAGPKDRLEGARDHVVDDPADPGRTITDIDQIEDGVLWEEKSATNAGDLQRWTGKHIDKKFASHLDARQYLTGYENAPIGFRFTESGVAPEFRSAVESAVERLRASHRDVRIFLEWS